ncbi:FAD binding domain-containing protein [Amycolatopsis echigonensis]|uniref:Xanthine dehydrogenase family protein subunit M n=1 Tax=Amycolatopsis echigonensis TaxID=2576905 RepID=A0A8E1W815_9PSEU|nr:xanthine dehydrogenase family protein subunit M [Amycolatopsis echigonensis]MBB2505219.1 xanthine dehydrogenase family protein subunit M [Amycolatopsis echigonensis]
MKPAPFDHIRATSVEHAVAVLAENGDSARVLAGGQSLVPLLATRRIQPALLVDINGLADLAYIRTGDGHVEIGALTRNRVVETSPVVANAAPLIVEALHHSGHVTIRNRSTIGGSASYAHPAGENPAALLTLGASVVLTGPAGRRILPVAEFFRGPHRTCAAPDELLTAVRVPVSPPGTRVAVAELARRHGDFALVAVLAALRLDGAGRIAAASIGIGGAGPTPVRAAGAERLLVGEAPSAELLRAAGAAAAAEVDPPADVHAPAAYRRRVTDVMTQRCLTRALPPVERISAA